MFKGRETACCVEAPGGASIDKSVIISACYQWKQVQPLFKIWKVMKGNEAINTVTELIHRAGKCVSFHHESQHFYRGILDRLPTDSFNLSKYKEKAAQDCQLGCDKTGSGLHPRGSGAEERLVWAVEVLWKAPSAHPHLHRRTWLIHTSSQRPPWVELVAWQQNCLALTDLSPLMHFMEIVCVFRCLLFILTEIWMRQKAAAQSFGAFCGSPCQRGRLVILLFCGWTDNKSWSPSLPWDTSWNKSKVRKMSLKIWHQALILLEVPA